MQMQRPWLQHYLPGTPTGIDPQRYPSLVAMFEDSFTVYAARPSCICLGNSLSYAELDDVSRAFAAWLQSCHLSRGARVAIMMPNIMQYPVAVVAILRAGYTVVNVNPLYKQREVQFQLSDSGAEAIIVLENFASVLQDALPHTNIKHVVIATLGDMLGMMKGALVNTIMRHVKKIVPSYTIANAVTFNRVLAAGSKLQFTRIDVGPNDIALLQYTGGTTGMPKAAVLLHRNLVANVLQLEAWQQPVVQKAPVIDDIVIVTALPLYHIFALTTCFLLGMRSGGVCLLIPNPRDINALIKELSRYKVNLFPAVSTLYGALLRHPDFNQIDWSGLKYAIGGGMAVQQTVAEAWMKATGRPIVEGYGLSETSPVLTCNLPTITKWTGTIGLPLPCTEISIRDEEGNEQKFGEKGEICARGPQVMAGYWQRPDETAKVMLPDGFFRTGDIGVMDEQGYVRIVDRKKDMITVSGFKVFPNEVEEVAMSHGGLRECALIGVADKHSGEAPKLFAVRKDMNLTARELRRFLTDQLASYKVPRQIEFRDELPKTSVGKISRLALREDASNEASDLSRNVDE
jgi:long-chain acyl-CoA synthetase